MSSGRKCKNCGGSDIEVDPARGDAVCTTCGSVLEDSIIVAEIQFEEGAHGSSSAIGQFVSADSKGGATKFGASFHVGDSGESRELTLKKARKGIANLCSQLQLNQHCTDTACGFFKMALSRNLTRGRRVAHVHAACVYMTCRTEGTAHLLIDISDVLQICCYELGKTYLKISHALCINIPAVDPCIYILRFASKLQFGAKTQQVANTALRLVQRMKRDSIHSGRRPSGLCGAALLIAARLHEFSRSSKDIVKIVKVHESTLRKRLLEFGDTPSSALTLDEFMNIDLEEEQDPPSFKAARKKDKERLQKFEEEADILSDLQKQIEEELEHNTKKRKSKFATPKSEVREAERFIEQSTMETVSHLLVEQAVDDPASAASQRGLGPDIASMGLAASLEDASNAPTPVDAEGPPLDLDLEGIDDDEIDSYIMSEKEFETKRGIWHRINADYLEEQKVKAERLQKEREEGKPEKKRKRAPRKRNVGPASSAGEAIEKILQEKKISTKINYDVLKSLSSAPAPNEPDNVDEEAAASTSESIKRRRLSSVSNHLEMAGTSNRRKMKGKAPMGLPIFEDVPKVEPKQIVKKEEKTENDEDTEKETTTIISDEEMDEDYEDDDQPADTTNEMGVLQMLRQHREDEEDNHEFGYDYYDEGDY